MSDPDAIAKSFVDYYYNMFDTNRAALQPLYQDSSIQTFEGSKIQGSAQIIQKLTSLPFKVCKHVINSTDAQPSLSGGLIVFTTGQLLPEGESNPLKFSQVFHLAPQGTGYFITNEIFRLNYG